MELTTKSTLIILLGVCFLTACKSLESKEKPRLHDEAFLFEKSEFSLSQDIHTAPNWFINPPEIPHGVSVRYIRGYLNDQEKNKANEAALTDLNVTIFSLVKSEELLYNDYLLTLDKIGIKEIFTDSNAIVANQQKINSWLYTIVIPANKVDETLDTELGSLDIIELPYFDEDSIVSQSELFLKNPNRSWTLAKQSAIKNLAQQQSVTISQRLREYSDGDYEYSEEVTHSKSIHPVYSIKIKHRFIYDNKVWVVL